MKIVIDFYSIGDFLSFTVWPLDVAEVTKVSCVKIYKQKMKEEGPFLFSWVNFSKLNRGISGVSRWPKMGLNGLVLNSRR